MRRREFLEIAAATLGAAVGAKLLAEPRSRCVIERSQRRPASSRERSWR